MGSQSKELIFLIDLPWTDTITLMKAISLTIVWLTPWECSLAVSEHLFGPLRTSTSFGRDIMRVLLVPHCSPTNRERELGLDRRETG